MSVVRRGGLVSLLLVALGCGRSERSAPPLDLRMYVPATVGDRARFVADDGHRSHVGVTAKTSAGLLVVHGTDRTAPTFLRVAAEGVDVVDPAGTVVMPQLRRPTGGPALPYRLPDGSACSFAVRAAARPSTIATTDPDAVCLETTRSCTLEPRGGLPRRTRTDEHELHCPGVGLVERSFRADPPLPFEGVRSAVVERLESAHVRGAARPGPEVALAARLVLLPSDVAAACGTTPTTSVLSTGPTLAEFTLADGPLRFVATAEAPGEPHVVADGRGGAVRIDAPPSCAAGVARLVPLVRSML